MRKCLSICLVLAALLGAAIPAQAARYAEVATEKGTLNLRAAAKDSAEILKKLARGSIVEILEDAGDWKRIRFGTREGYVMTRFLKEITDLPYAAIGRDDTGEAVLGFKRALHRLGYIKSEEINTKFDQTMQNALVRMQLMNGVALDPDTVSPELQALIAWDMVCEAKSGYLDLATDAASGLSVAIYCWDTAGVLYEKDQAVKVTIAFAAQATGGQGPYTITVKKALSGGEAFGDVVTSPFSQVWGQNTDRLYVYATVVDAAGNTVTACAPYKYTLPQRYQGLG